MITDINIKTKCKKLYFRDTLRKDWIILIAQLHNYNNSESMSLKISTYLWSKKNGKPSSFQTRCPEKSIYENSQIYILRQKT